LACVVDARERRRASSLWQIPMVGRAAVEGIWGGVVGRPNIAVARCLRASTHMYTVAQHTQWAAGDSGAAGIQAWQCGGYREA